MLVRNNFPGIFKPCWGQHLIDIISTNFMKRQLYLSILFSLLGLSVYAQRTQELFDASVRALNALESIPEFSFGTTQQRSD